MTSSDKLQERVEALEDRVARLENTLFTSVDLSPVHKTKRSSAKEFLLTKNVKSGTQKLLALAYFLEHIQGAESFNIADLEMAFRAAKEKVPGNMNDVVNKNIGRGFLMDSASRKDSKKAWCLTSTGEQHVENELTK